MTAAEMIQLISTLGFPIGLVVLFIVFFNAKVWPWFTTFMTGYVDVLQQNTSAMQKMTAAIAAIAEDIRAQPNADLAKQTTTLMTRMDEQHIQLSQQIAAMKTEIGLKADNNLARLMEIKESVRWLRRERETDKP